MNYKARLFRADELPYGISELKRDAAFRYSAAKPDSLIHGDRLQCCIEGCEETVARRRKGEKVSGEHFCPKHRISISVKPTYIFQEQIRNFITGRDILGKIEKVEKWRLGYETSEDALSWNVFVSLYGMKALNIAFERLTGIACSEEPELYLWGNRIGAECARLPELKTVRDALESGMAIQTEPDIILRVPGHAIVLIEAKFGSPNGTFKGKEKRFESVEKYLAIYQGRPGCPDPLNRSWILEQKSDLILEQLCRNAIFSHRFATQGEQAFVINLVCRNSINCEEAFRQHLAGGEVLFFRRTWEDLYELPIVQSDQAAVLRKYLENKTLNLRQAFDIRMPVRNSV